MSKQITKQTYQAAIEQTHAYESFKLTANCFFIDLAKHLNLATHEDKWKELVANTESTLNVWFTLAHERGATRDELLNQHQVLQQGWPFVNEVLCSLYMLGDISIDTLKELSQAMLKHKYTKLIPDKYVMTEQ